MEKLDLHNLNYERAKAETIRFIEEYWNEVVDLKVITGHSLVMKKVVMEVLNEYKLEYRIGDILGTNKGYIVVFMGR